MKNIFLIVSLTIICNGKTSIIMAQKDKVALGGKWVPAKIISPGGSSADLLMRYQSPSFFKDPNNTFWIADTWSPSEVNSTQQPAHARRTLGTIEAFMIDNTIWALRPSPGTEGKNFVNLNQQGAIESYKYITTEYKSEDEFAKMDG